MVCKRPHGVSPAVPVNGVVVPWGRNMFPIPPRAFVPVHPVPAIPIPMTVTTMVSPLTRRPHHGSNGATTPAPFVARRIWARQTAPHPEARSRCGRQPCHTHCAALFGGDTVDRF